MNNLLLLLVVSIFALSGCARYESKINSFADENYSGGNRFFIAPGMSNVTQGDLEFNEYATIVSKVLVNKGYVQIDNPRNADLAVFLSYAIGDPSRVQSAYTMPVYGQTGGGTANVYMTTTGGGGRTVSSQGTITTPATYGVTGYNTIVDTQTVYSRSLLLEAFDNTKHQSSSKMVQVWKVSVVSTGTTDNLREVMPKMAIAMEDYIGTNSTVTVEVDDNGKKYVYK